MAYRSMRALHPAVEHAAREWLHGAPPIHALREATAVGYLMGRGMSPERALREFERLEALPSTTLCIACAQTRTRPPKVGI